MLRVYEALLDRLPEEHIEVLIRPLLRDGYRYENGRIYSDTQVDTNGLPTVEWASELADGFDIPQLNQQVRRITDSIHADPDLAVGTSKELLETCCKTILVERDIVYDENEDIGKLLKLVQKSLELLPENIDQHAKGVEYIKRLLNNLGGVARGMSEVRNKYGTGHGKHGRSSSLKPRHAKLAVGAATTLAVFLYETHVESKGSIPNPPK